MKKAIITLLTAAVLLAALLLGGCGEQTILTLEDIAAANPDIGKTIKEELIVPKEMSAEVAFSGDSFDITYKFKDPINDNSEKIMIEAFDKNAKAMEKSCDEAIENIQKQTDITGITCTIHIVNSSGKETWNHVYPEQE